MTRLPRSACGRRLAVATLLAAGALHAEEANPGVAVDRLQPAVGPASLVAVEGAAVTKPGAVSWAASLGLVHDPITLRQAFTGALVTRPVRDQLVADVALEFGIWKRLAVAVAAPIVLYQDGDRLQGTGVDERPLAATVAGDVRVRIKGQLVGDAMRPGLHASLLVQVTAPTGGRQDFAATDGATVEPRLVVDARLGRVTLAASLGARFQKERALFFTRFGDELTWSAAAAVALVERTRLGLSAIVEGAGAVGPSTGTRPAELRGALRLALARGFVVDAGAGGGLDRDVGAPAWRVFVVGRGSLPLAR